jgi:predicted transposase YbfD/YdcC
MAKGAEKSIVAQFAELSDPRAERGIRHSLEAILVIALCAVLCGADNWVEIEEFGRAKQGWLSSFLDLPHGIPAHDTFGRVFAALDPVQFERCFRRWTRGIARVLGAHLIALDGQALRRAHQAEERPLQVVSAWASANRLVLAQRAVPDKANELSARPVGLEMLALEGCIVTIDAMGTHAAIAQAIVDKGADYVLALKGNQGRMEADVQALFADAQGVAYTGIAHSYGRVVDGGHGRIEIRETWAITDPAYLAYVNPAGAWPSLRSLVMVRAERRLEEKTSVETRYYLSSLDTPAAHIGSAVRAHWGIENSVPWVLDMAFRQDENRARLGHAARNLATLHHLALNLLRAETTSRVGLQAKRRKAGWDARYLLKVLQVL